MTKRLELTIFGQVQGVLFRQSVLELAQALSLTGWVKNHPANQVMVWAEGNEEDLKKLLDFCHHGPAAAQVDKIEVKWVEAPQQFVEFLIIYD